uniref:ATP-binding cassette domain-containing protein n=1 Tax=Desulfobacca acetoxidans TaxID=60893 RepID=A0A7V4LCW0_9BACT
MGQPAALKQTALNAVHRRLGARMVDFGGWDMPVQYSGVIEEHHAVRRQVGLLFQNPDDQLFCPTVLEDVAFGPLNLGKSRQEAVAIARETMAQLGLEGFEERVTYKLSGGEKKLVALATVLAMQPRLLLLDEPTTGLDEATKHRLIHLLQGLKISYMIVSHETDFLNHTVTECCHVHMHCCRPDTMPLGGKKHEAL